MWTKDQLMAINEQGKNIIVSAGAGSGKTAVLSERILRHVKEGVDLNQLLVLTFTNAAAKEMKERIRKKLIENNLSSQLEKLEQSYITTFDAYSLALCKKYFYKLNISPNISVMSNVVIFQKKKEIIEEILDEEYEKQNPLLLDYLEKFSTKDDKELVKFISDLSNKISLKPDVDKYIDEYMSLYYNDEYIAELHSNYLQIIVAKFADIRNQLEKIECHTEGISWSNLITRVIDSKQVVTYDDVKNFIEEFKLPTKKKDSSEVFLQIRKHIEKEIKSLKKDYFGYENFEDLVRVVLEPKKYIQLFLDLLKETFRRLDDFKKQKNSYEFIDISKMAISLVTDFEDVRLEIKNNLKEILIDEYQDTSDLQETFIKKIENDNLYMVGDIKQSIYRFRNANPYIFKEKYDKYALKNGGIKIDLNKNFRSREEVVNNINLTFENIMTTKYGDADYMLDHKMNYGNKKYDNAKDDKDYNMQVLSYIKCDDYKAYSKSEVEAFIIAKDIKDKMKHKTFDDGSLRETKFSDFAILIDRSTSFNTIKKILESEGIPVSIEADINLKESYLNKIITNIFNLVSLVKKEKINKEYFYAFTSVARSFLFEYSDSLIYEIVKNKSIDNEIYLKALNISKLINNKSTSEIYLAILKEFNVYDKLSLIGDVNNSMVQLEFINNTIKSLSDLSYTFNEVINQLNDVIDEKLDVKYQLKSTGKDSVTIMTTHKSKGLEFPICYFPLLQSKFNVKEIKAELVYSDKYQILAPSYDGGSRRHIVHELNQYDLKTKEISEKIRLYYVALTRAKEQIVLIYEDEEYADLYSEPENYKSFTHFVFTLYNHYSNFIRTIQLNTLNLSKNYLSKLEDSKYNTCKNNLEFKETNSKTKEVSKMNVSKKVNKILDSKSISNINLGLDFHKYLEYLDLKNPNVEKLNATDFIKKKLKKTMALGIFKDIKNARVFKEYEFISTLDNKRVHGIIDLMLVYDTHIDIIDYKLSNVDDAGYDRQLKIYKEFISTKSNLKVNIYLLSILNETIKKIDI